MLSVRMNISNTNEHLFPIINTCIYYNPLMNPVTFVLIKFRMADLSLFLFTQIDKIFEKVVRQEEYLQHQWTFLPDSLHMH